MTACAAMAWSITSSPPASAFRSVTNKESRYTMSTISIIGPGNMARLIGVKAVAAGNPVEVIGRDAAKAAALAKALGGGATTGTFGAVPAGDIVLLAVKYASCVPVVTQYGDALAGKIIVDMSNDPAPGGTGLLTPEGTSAAQDIARAAPASAHVVKAFNAVFGNVLALDRPLDVLIAGDDAQAKASVSAFIESLGLRPLDAGPGDGALAGGNGPGDDGPGPPWRGELQLQPRRQHPRLTDGKTRTAIATRPTSRSASLTPSVARRRSWSGNTPRQGRPRRRVRWQGAGHARGNRAQFVDRVGASVPQQAGAAAWRGRLDHGGGRADPRVGPAQVLLDLRQVRAHRRRLAGAKRRLPACCPAGFRVRHPQRCVPDPARRRQFPGGVPRVVRRRPGRWRHRRQLPVQRVGVAGRPGAAGGGGQLVLGVVAVGHRPVLGQVPVIGVAGRGAA